jgi:FAD/FMN-containing dehydrogenase
MDELMADLCPDLEVLWYGHIGDGNLHLNILKPAETSLQEFEHRAHEISERSYALTQALGGSISAEHGIGILKSPWLGRVRSEAEIDLMRGIKKVFDPAGIMNPGKLFPTEQSLVSEAALRVTDRF